MSDDIESIGKIQKRLGLTDGDLASLELAFREEQRQLDRQKGLARREELRRTVEGWDLSKFPDSAIEQLRKRGLLPPGYDREPSGPPAAAKPVTSLTDGIARAIATIPDLAGTSVPPICTYPDHNHDAPSQT